jgi:hypothetical protein
MLFFTTRKLFPPANHGIVEFGDHIERLVTFKRRSLMANSGA